MIFLKSHNQSHFDFQADLHDFTGLPILYQTPCH